MAAQQQQPLHAMRPYRLRRFAGDSGTDADDFIREAKLVLQLQPMGDAATASWLLGALDGRARQEVLQLPAEEVNTPEKLFALLDLNWGEQRDTFTLAAAFYKRQQGLTQSVADYALVLRALWAKANAAPDTLSASMLRDAFSNGLHPASLKRDITRFVRERPESTFAAAAKTEALRWMREDSSQHGRRGRAADCP